MTLLKLPLLLMGISFFLFLFSCNDENEKINPTVALPPGDIQGKIQLPQGVQLDTNQVSISSLAGRGTIIQNSFSVNVLDSVGDILMLENEQGDYLMIAFVETV